MKGALVILAVLVVIGVLIWAFDRKGRLQMRQRLESADDAAPADVTDTASSGEGECCGRHAVCEKTSLSPLTDEAVYYDDHELDRFRGREPESYTEAETEEFRDILMSLLPDDVAGWSRSLQVRGIVLPSDVRDEVLMIVGELRSKS